MPIVPINDLLILNRNTLFRLLSALAFFSGCITTAHHTLFLYYLEENFGFNDKDIAILLLIIGLMGLLVQVVILKPLNSFIGERRVIVVAFLVGSLHNYLYGVAKSKRTIFISATIASLTGMSFPTISAIKANNVVSRVLKYNMCLLLLTLKQLTHTVKRIILSRMSWNKARYKEHSIHSPLSLPHSDQ